MSLIKNTIKCKCGNEGRLIKYDIDLNEVYYCCNQCSREYKKELRQVIDKEGNESKYFTLSDNGEIVFKIPGSFFWCEGIIGMDEEENKLWLDSAYSIDIHDATNTRIG